MQKKRFWIQQKLIWKNIKLEKEEPMKEGNGVFGNEDKMGLHDQMIQYI